MFGLEADFVLDSLAADPSFSAVVMDDDVRMGSAERESAPSPLLGFSEVVDELGDPFLAPDAAVGGCNGVLAFVAAHVDPASSLESDGFAALAFTTSSSTGILSLSSP